MTELSDESRALLDLEAGLDEPTGDELDARRLAVFAALGVPAPTIPGPSAPNAGETASVPNPEPTPTTSAGAPTGMSVGLKLALGLVTAAVLGTLGVLVVGDPAPDDLGGPATSVGDVPLMPPPEAGPMDAGEGANDVVEPPTAPADPSPLEPAAPAVDVPVVPAPRPRPRDAEGSNAPAEATSTGTSEPAPPAVADPTPTEPAPGDPLSEESMLVAAGSAQLRAGHATEALSLFERALARHPSGALRVEALAGRALALCRAGRMEAGQREAERFLASYPRSPSAPRIRSACRVEP
ncbi:MAG: hypothetical protein H6726_20005 [Sandaracinaceae bacterium]|nr:hypothetical protein [Sandaracinaceae bacterium]